MNRAKTFTDLLYELFVEQKVTLIKSLEIMAHEKKSSFEKACDEIKSDLLNGCSFVNALRTCKYLDFDAVYISFIGFSEVTGNLGETLAFLKKREERIELNRSKLVEAAMYPSFVVTLAIVGCIFLNRFSFEMGGASIDGGALFTGILIVVSVCCFAFMILHKNLCEDKLYEAFLAIAFLIKSGINVSAAVGAGIIIAGPGTKFGLYFQQAKRNLECGMNVFAAFSGFGFNDRIKNALYYANMAGDKSDVFEKIAVKMGIEDEKRKKRCLAMVEPVFIGITGLFLMILLVIYFIPLMNDTSWIS